MKIVSIIRDRGQLTIPDSIRKYAGWIQTSSVVTISAENPQEITITPHQLRNEIEWDRLFEHIKKSRAIKGKAHIGAAEFILELRS